MSKKEKLSKALFPNRSDKKPAGIDMTPYAMKNEKGKRPVIARLKSKLSLTSTRIELRMLVTKDMTKKISMTNNTIWRCFFGDSTLFIISSVCIA